MYGIWTCINLCCSLLYNYAKMLVFIFITYCVMPILPVLLQQVQQCHTQAQQCRSAAVLRLRSGNATPSYHNNLCCAWTVIYIMIIYLTRCAAPHRSMDVGGAPSLSLKCESWLLMPIWEFYSLFTHLEGGSTPMAQKSQLYFISFVSSNWVVINHQKREIESAMKP
jgi:hypothetical protein